MTPKILSQAGISLADIYNVEGSIAGVDFLDANQIQLVHDMGGTVFSERLVGDIIRGTTGAVAQNTFYDVTLNPPQGIYRVLGVFVFALTAARSLRAAVSLRSTLTGREIPIFAWTDTGDVEKDVRMIDNGGAAINALGLIQSTGKETMPSLGLSVGQRGQVGDEIVFRGSTSGFGAGTVETIVLVYTAAAFSSQISPVGLPIPGW